MGGVLDIPGYKEAVAAERLAREVSFLPITETVAGLELVPMTLRQYLVLSLTKSPLLTGETPGPGHLLDFLWLLHPRYSPKGGFHKWLMVRKLRRCIPPVGTIWDYEWLRAKRQRRVDLAVYRLTRLVVALRNYVGETLQDWQPSQAPEGTVEIDHYCDGAAICALVAREYGWTQETTLNMPMKQLLQFLKEIKVFHGTKVPLCNPSDRVKAEWLDKQQRNIEIAKVCGDRSFVSPGGRS
jgi:hypothetical protein